MAVKNLHGIISDYDKLFTHNYREAALARKLTDLLRIRHIDLNVLDGLMAQEADHATEGIPVEMGLILAEPRRGGAGRGRRGGGRADPGGRGHHADRGRGRAGRGRPLADRGRWASPSPRCAAPSSSPTSNCRRRSSRGCASMAATTAAPAPTTSAAGWTSSPTEGRLDPARPLSIIVGRDPEVPESIEGPVLILGDCAMASASVKPLRDRLLLEGRLHARVRLPAHVLPHAGPATARLIAPQQRLRSRLGGTPHPPGEGLWRSHPSRPVGSPPKVGHLRNGATPLWARRTPKKSISKKIDSGARRRR